MAPSPHASLGSRAARRFSDSLVRSKSERRVHRPLSPAREREGGYSSAPEDDAAPSKPPPALSMGVIVDRSSFDSEDRLNQGHAPRTERRLISCTIPSIISRGIALRTARVVTMRVSRCSSILIQQIEEGLSFECCLLHLGLSVS